MGRKASLCFEARAPDQPPRPSRRGSKEEEEEEEQKVPSVRVKVSPPSLLARSLRRAESECERARAARVRPMGDERPKFSFRIYAAQSASSDIVCLTRRSAHQLDRRSWSHAQSYAATFLPILQSCSDSTFANAEIISKLIEGNFVSIHGWLAARFSPNGIGGSICAHPISFDLHLHSDQPTDRPYGLSRDMTCFYGENIYA